MPEYIPLDEENVNDKPLEYEISVSYRNVLITIVLGLLFVIFVVGMVFSAMSGFYIGYMWPTAKSSSLSSPSSSTSNSDVASYFLGDSESYYIEYYNTITEYVYAYFVGEYSDIADYPVDFEEYLSPNVYVNNNI